MHVHVCSRCGIEGKYYAKNLCESCYSKLRIEKSVGTCVKCKRSLPLNSQGICRNCRPKNSGKIMQVCTSCGSLKPHRSNGLCIACYAREYRKTTGYKGPIRQCIECKNILPIKARGMCRSCYDKSYRLEHLEEIKSREKQYRVDNSEHVRSLAKKWREGHKKEVHDSFNKYYREHKEELKIKKRFWCHKNKEHLNIMRRNKLYKGTTIKIKKAIDPNEKILTLINQIPVMKRQWVKEFLSGPFKDHSSSTIITFLNNMVRLIIYLDKEGKAQGGWNLVELIDIEKCQVETGILKDSLRVFFTWLHKRKHATKKLAIAIPTETNKLRKTILPFKKLKELYDRWTQGEGNFNERISGLLIIYYGFTNAELRNFKLDDYKYDRIIIDEEEILLNEKIIKIMNEYLDWRRSFYRGVPDDNPYFFISQESFYTKQKVDEGYFANTFKRNGLPRPSIIRKTMIYFFKNDPHNDVFKIAALFRIMPRSASRYW